MGFHIIPLLLASTSKHVTTASIFRSVCDDGAQFQVTSSRYVQVDKIGLTATFTAHPPESPTFGSCRYATMMLSVRRLPQAEMCVRAARLQAPQRNLPLQALAADHGFGRVHGQLNKISHSQVQDHQVS